MNFISRPLIRAILLLTLLSQSHARDHVLITGGNRGIGLALVKQYLSKGSVVFTTCRNQETSKELRALDNKHLHILQVNFLDPHPEDKVKKFLAGTPVDILIHNASLFPYRVNKLPKLDTSEWLDAFKINVISPIKISISLKQNLRDSNHKKLVFISSRRASNNVNIKDNYRGRIG